jgi:hypothetical protein
MWEQLTPPEGLGPIMSIMTITAIIGSMFALSIGAISLLGENGYGFDLRGRRGRRRDDARLGGRRENDLAA